ncbi:MAG: hypothetical protein U5K81_15010 [Trueperaceae bacterium]|nr:hypothetical protein [Trueperaceae bacterium]
MLAAVVLALALSACGGEGTASGDDAPRWNQARWDVASWRP